MYETYSVLSVYVLLKHTGSEKRYEIHFTQMFVDKIKKQITLYVTQKWLAGLTGVWTITGPTLMKSLF